MNIPSADNRPRDIPLTNAELVRFAAPGALVRVRSKFRYRKLIAAVAAADAAAAKPVSIVLATATETVTFEPRGDTVTILARTNAERWGRRLTLTRAAARRHYAKLLSLGYYVW